MCVFCLHLHICTLFLSPQRHLLAASGAFYGQAWSLPLFSAFPWLASQIHWQKVPPSEWTGCFQPWSDLSTHSIAISPAFRCIIQLYFQRHSLLLIFSPSISSCRMSECLFCFKQQGIISWLGLGRVVGWVRFGFSLFSSSFSRLRGDLRYVYEFATLCWLSPELSHQAHITSMVIKCFQHSLRKQAFIGEYIWANWPPDFLHKPLTQ